MSEKKKKGSSIIALPSETGGKRVAENGYVLTPELEALVYAAREVEEDFHQERAEAGKLKVDLRQAKELNEERREQLSEFQTDLDRLKEEIHQLQADVRRKDALEAENEDLRKKLEQYVAQEIEKVQDASMARKVLQDENAALKQEIETKLSEAQNAIDESSKLKREVGKLRRRLDNEKEWIENLNEAIDNNYHVRKARAQLKFHKEQFVKVATRIYQELEQLKLKHPIQTLIKAKEFEIERYDDSLRQIPADHPDRSTAEYIVQSHRSELKRLQDMIKAVEGDIRRHSDQINQAMEQDITAISMFDSDAYPEVK